MCAACACSPPQTSGLPATGSAKGAGDRPRGWRGPWPAPVRGQRESGAPPASPARVLIQLFFFSFPSLFSIVSHPQTGPAAPAGTWRPPNPGCGLCWGRGRWWSTFFWRGGRGRRGRGAEKKRAAPGGERECRSGPHRGLPSHSFFTPRCLQRRPDTHTHTHHPPHAPLPVGHRPGGRPALQAHQAGPAPAGAVHGPEVSFAFFFFVRGFVGARRVGASAARHPAPPAWPG